MQRKILSYLSGLVVAMMLTATGAMAIAPKYVFFFLGDGMSSSQIQTTEAYLTTLNGGSATLAEDLLKSENRLNMSKFPVLGMQTTYDAHALMTDSASSATAFACGLKTLSGVIGMDDTKTYSYKSIAQLAAENGKKVGIISSVSLDHATPAAYYASVPSRSDYAGVDLQMAATGYEFFGGGGLKTYKTQEDVQGLFGETYAVLNSRDGIMDLMSAPRDNVVCINPWLQDSQAMPYAIDRPATNVSLKEMTEVAIACLEQKSAEKPNGFFLMVEGGKIDWACHANDAVATIEDTLAFDGAIGAAVEFYNAHPYQTLIVVTGDHETGGMTVGHATTAYTAYYDRLMNQSCSFTYFGANQWAAHKTAYAENYDWSLENNMASNSDIINLMADTFGLVYEELNDYQKEKLEDAYDMSMSGENQNSSAENDLLYGSYEPIIVTITHILNENASIGWTSYSHTGVPVPVFAKGIESNQFSGFYDNTDIAKKLADAMDVAASMPVEKTAAIE